MACNTILRPFCGLGHVRTVSRYLQANMWVLRDKFQGRMHLFMKYGGSCGFVLSALLAIVLLFTSVKPDKS